jgi:hypothetical protein
MSHIKDSILLHIDFVNRFGSKNVVNNCEQQSVKSREMSDIQRFT